MPGRLYLSPLLSEGGTLRRPSPGRWFAAKDFLDQYSTDILVEADTGDHPIVRGVPSVFAQPIYFWQAFQDRKHPSFATVHRQWRGLLGCFALQDWLKLPLHVDRFRLDPLTGAGADGADGVLRGVLKAHLPEPKEAWLDWWLIRCDGVLLGATSPWTMFYPAAHHEQVAAIPWQRSGSLIDPLEHYGKGKQGSSVELELLAGWVEKVLDSRSDRWGAPNAAAWDSSIAVIAEALGAWRDELRPYRKPAQRPVALAPTNFSDVVSPYSAFMQRVDATEVKPQGELLLENSQGEKFIVLKRTGLDSQRRIFGGAFASEIDLDSMSGEGQGPWTTTAGRTIPFPYLIAEDVFLSSKLLAIPVSKGGIAAQGGEQSFALPLASAALRFFSFESIRDRRLKIDLRSSDRAIEVRLSFDLADGGRFDVTRSYDRNQDVIFLVEEETPALTLWPNFYSESWRHSTAVFTKAEKEGRGVLLSVAPIAGSGALLDRNPTDVAEQKWFSWQVETPLLGFELYDESVDGVKSCGLVLRAERKPPAQIDKGLKWEIAVDFGTSNTLPMKQVGGATPEPLAVGPRTILLTRPAKAIMAKANLAFYPLDKPILAPFPTILLQNDGYAVVGNTGAVAGQLYSPRYLPNSNVSGVVQDLKWSRSGVGRSDLPIRAYLQILVKALLAEAVASGVASVSLHWSYPLSLPESPLQAMRNFWQTVPSEFSTDHLEVKITQEGGRSESEAMSRYFAGVGGGLPIRAEGLSIAVDIGGGSTDVGFWSAQRFLDQFSFKLAGNDLLVRPAVKLEGFLEGLAQICGSPAGESGKLKAANGDRMGDTKAAIEVNAILAQSAGKVPHALHSRLPAGDRPWTVVRTAIFLFFGGLSFYLGLHSRKQIKHLSRTREFAVLFGGKASGLLLWLSNEQKQLQPLLVNMFLAGLSYDDDDRLASTVVFYGPGLEPVPSMVPKAEVAHGLLLDPLKGEPPGAVSTTAVGEIGWRIAADAAEALGWDTEVSLKTLSELRAPDNLETGYAAYFVSNLVPRFSRDLALDTAGLDSLKLTVPDVEDVVRMLAVQKVLQPVFGAELRLVIDKYFAGAGVG